MFCTLCVQLHSTKWAARCCRLCTTALYKQDKPGCKLFYTLCVQLHSTNRTNQAASCSTLCVYNCTLQAELQDVDFVCTTALYKQDKPGCKLFYTLCVQLHSASWAARCGLCVYNCALQSCKMWTLSVQTALHRHTMFQLLSFVVLALESQSTGGVAVEVSVLLIHTLQVNTLAAVRGASVCEQDVVNFGT